MPDLPMHEPSHSNTKGSSGQMGVIELVGVLLPVLLNPLRCHSWVERVSEITVDGTRTGQVGYARGNGKVAMLNVEFDEG